MTDPARPSILVVGATGFLGGKILRSIVARRGGPSGIRALARNPASDAARGLGVEVVKGDLLDRASLDGALRGIDVVVSSAAGYMRGDPTADTDGYRNLVQASKAAGVRRFVLVSILKCELATDVPHFFNKKKMEEMLVESGVSFVAIRPGAFLDMGGGFDPYQGANRGRVRTIFDPRGRWSWIHPDDVAEYVAKATDLPDIEGVVEVGMDAEGHTFGDLIGVLGKVIGKPIEVSVIPQWIPRIGFALAAAFSERAADMRAMFRFFESGQYVHTNLEPQRRFFGQPPTLEASMRRVAKSHGWV